MANQNQTTKAIEVGNVKISMLDEEEHKRFLLGLLANIKQYYKDPKNLTEYQETKKIKGV